MFESQEKSHEHSMAVINALNQYDDFLVSIKALLDLGCGKGYDLNTWANIKLMDDEGNATRPLNIKCIGLDRKVYKDTTETQSGNIRLVEHDFNLPGDLPTPRKVDVVWCHDVLQYSYSPLELLGKINRAMNKNGMLYLCVPSAVNVKYKKFHNYTPSNHYATFTLTQLIYFLALNGFDCKDAYFKKEPYVDMIEVITYKNSDPLEYDLSWYDLVERKILNENASNIINSLGYLSDQGLITKWIDGVVYDYRHHS
jgi:SAM-dependent methyltransferase